MAPQNRPSARAVQDLKAKIAALEQRVAALEAVQQMATTLTSDLGLAPLLALILSSAIDVLNASAGSLLLYDPATDELVFQVVQGGSGKSLLERRIHADQGLAGWVFHRRQPIIVHDAEADERHLTQINESTGFRTTSLVAAPLAYKNNAIGVIEVLNKKSGEHFDADDQDLLMAFASQSAVAIENARLYQQVVAERDRLLAVEEEVRRKLARELHDGPSQILSSMIMGLKFIRQVIVREPARVDAELTELERQATLALRQVRDTLFDLRPVALETQGLAAALQVLVERQSETQGVEFHVDTHSFNQRFSPKVEAAVFSIVQEALGNAQKHSRAQNVWIELQPVGEELIITVRDDGHGFDLPQMEEAYAQRGNLGLLNMKERAEIANAKLTIKSKRGNGTTVTLKLKLDHAAH